MEIKSVNVLESENCGILKIWKKVRIKKWKANGNKNFEKRNSGNWSPKIG